MLVEFVNVRLTRGGQNILEYLNVRLSESRIGIIGPNGAGKSSFARLINGLLKPQAGHVLVNGQDVQKNLKAVRKKVGFLFQNPENQLVFPEVHEDMDFGLKAHLRDAGERQMRIEQTLTQLDILHLATRAVHTLSGGQKQLVALATVLSAQPELVIFDEPTTQLDLRYRNRLVHILQTLPQPAIVLTHDLSMLQSFDRVLVIAQGGIVKDGQPADVLAWYQQHFS